MQNEKYNFDPNGNRKTAEIQGQKQTYKTGEYNRLISDENYNYEYDLEGNRISKTDKEGKTTKYTWDNHNRLIKVTTPTTEVEYLYDYLNRLVKRTENKIDQKYFVHDNWQIVLQFDNKENKPTNRYLWGTKQDELICDNNNWILGDHLNTIRDVVKSDGNVANHLEYNSFGKIISETKNDNNFSFAYTGKLTDKSSDLQWNINRWYDSNVGIWVSEDPIGIESRDINFFGYAQNSPITLLDLLGLVCSTSAPTRYCCKNFVQVYTLGFATVSDCVNAIITSTWWGDYSSHVSTFASISALFAIVEVPVRFNLAINLSIIAGQVWSSDTAKNYCEAFFCELPYSQSCSCCEGSWFREYWTCSCSGTGKLYSGDGDTWYFGYKPSGQWTAVTSHWIW
jgi:RHS repeat-associated protein